MATTFRGNFSYYELCLNGRYDTGTGGACGDCDDTMYHLAWPYLNNGTCLYNCGPNPMKSCSTPVYINDSCKAVAEWGYIKDCLPASQQSDCNLCNTCNDVVGCESDYRYPVADLTTAFFIALHGSLRDGRVKCFITIY